MTVEWLKNKALVFATLPYNGALHHYTLGPISQLVKEQDDTRRSRILLYKFRLRKEEELRFIHTAVCWSLPRIPDIDQSLQSTMSAAAVIGVFSWSNIGESYWLARLCWYCSFWLSIFSLLSSTQNRILDQLPKDQHEIINEARLQLLLRIVLTSHNCHKSDLESKRTNMNYAVQSDLFMLFFWQSSFMLMSYSWAAFLVGYALYLLTPVIDVDTWTVEQTVSLRSKSYHSI